MKRMKRRFGSNAHPKGKSLSARRERKSFGVAAVLVFFRKIRTALFGLVRGAAGAPRAQRITPERSADARSRPTVTAGWAGRSEFRAAKLPRRKAPA